MEAELETKRSGPPNRMNDLPYREWMKFQKSFFRYQGDQALARECLHFFTKAMWPDGQVSRSLMIGFGVPADITDGSVRLLEWLPGCATTEQVIGALEQRAGGALYDWVFVDLRSVVRDASALTTFVGRHADRLFAALRRLLVDKRYCGVAVGTGVAGGGGFPLPWSVALAARAHLRLRDEKVALVEDDGSLFYCLFMQADDDARPAARFLPENVVCGDSRVPIPAWSIPRPPPRKRSEILHPAKYPETLIGDFVRLFTEPGERVFDPMVGTGSTVVAALRADRSGYGVDLAQEFVDIGRARLGSEFQPTLFCDIESEWRMAQGDALRLDEVDELSGLVFDYSCTSPPYWSMLRNPGSENQRARRSRNLKLVYSEDEHDLGNVGDYDGFLDLLQGIYESVATRLREGGHLTVVVKNVKRDHTLHPLAWDLVARLAREDGRYEYVGTTLWCQDDVGLKPFAVGIYWVSNILHQYCLHFRRR